VKVGLLDLPGPLFDVVDAALHALHAPPLVRVALYAGTCAWLSMYLYRRCSDQQALRGLRAEIVQMQAALATHEGSFAELNALIRRNLALSLRQLALTLRPALIASVPLLFVLPWLSNNFESVAPAPGDTLVACAEPAVGGLRWDPPAAAPSAGCWRLTWDDAHLSRLSDSSGTSLFAFSGAPRSTVVHKYTPYNRLLGNPDGYLAESAPFERLTLRLAPQELLALGPAWLRTWQTAFFTVLLLVSIALKLSWKIH